MTITASDAREHGNGPRRSDQHKAEALEIERGRATAEPRTDGGTPTAESEPMTDDTPTTDDGTDIKPGDVVLDLAQGRPMHVLEVYENEDGEIGDVGEWSEENNYNLIENYGNGRLGATADDPVFECVYCGSVKSEPSKTYAFPESRLARIETEAADGGRQVRDRIVVDVLEQLFARAAGDDEQAMGVLETYAADVGFGDEVTEARELADAELLIGGEE